MDCIFCKIAKKEIPSGKVYEDDLIYAFNDINPQAPVHVLIIPKMHIISANEINDSNKDILAHIFKVIAQLAKELGVAESGYRVVTNCGEDGGQSVSHLHFHLLGKRNLSWPPG